MKPLLMLIAVLLSCACAGPVPTAPSEPLNGYAGAVLAVRGMSCPLCSNNLDGRLKKVPGVAAVSINLETGAVTVRFSPDAAPGRAELEAAVKDAGFTLGGMELLR